MTNIPEDESREPGVSPAAHSASLTPAPACTGAEERPVEFAAAEVTPDEPIPEPLPPALETGFVSYAQPGEPLSLSQSPAPVSEPQLFQSFIQPPVRPPVRIPHLGHLSLLIPIGGVAFACTIAVLFIPMRFHLFGWSLSTQAAATNVPLLLSTEAILYLFTFALSFVIFPLFWHEKFFAGLQWRGAVALHRFWPLAATALGCAGLAALDEVLMPGPSNAPIEKMMRAPGAAWLMFAFGTTIAPFFEEMFFRGFLLPALCTAFDWTAERVSIDPRAMMGAKVRPRWSSTAVTVTAGAFVGSPACIYLARHAFVAGHLRMGLFVFGIVIPIVAILSGFFLVIALRKVPSREDFPLLDPNGHPQWSLSAMVFASVLTSLPFALLHVDQQGHSLGPFLLLILVSLVLCTVRLKTRSLAASTLVHACYNFIIFSLALIGTGGFRHFDKM